MMDQNEKSKKSWVLGFIKISSIFFIFIGSKLKIDRVVNIPISIEKEF